MKKTILLVVIMKLSLLGISQVVVPGQVTSVASMKTYFGPVNQMYVSGTNEQYAICSVCTANEVSVFSGAGGRKWIKINGNMGVGNAITGASAGSILYVGTNGTLQQPSATRGLYYDSTNNSFRIMSDLTHYIAFTVDASGNGSVSSTGGTTYTINPSLTLNSNFTIGSSAGTGNLYVSSTAIGSTVSQVQIAGGTNTGARIFERGSTNIVLGTPGQVFAEHIIGEQAVTEATSGNHPLITAFAVRAPVVTNGSATTSILSTLYVNAAPSGVTGTTGNYSLFDSSGVAHFGDKLEFNSTLTTTGTTGNQTINKPSGTINFASGATSITVTNSQVTTSSLIIPVRMTAGTGAVIDSVIPSSGSFVITLSTAPSAEFKVGFLVIN